MNHSVIFVIDDTLVEDKEISFGLFHMSPKMSLKKLVLYKNLKNQSKITKKDYDLLLPYQNVFNLIR